MDVSKIITPDIQSKIDYINSIKQKETNRLIYSSIFSVIALVAVFSLFNISKWFIPLIFIFLTFAFFLVLNIKKINTQVFCNEHIAQPIIAKLYPNLKHFPNQGLSVNEYAKSNLFGLTVNSYFTNNLYIGHENNTIFQFCHVLSKRFNQALVESYPGEDLSKHAKVVVFNGIVYVMPFNKPIIGHHIIVKADKLKLESKGAKIKPSNQLINKKFTVYSNSEVEFNNIFNENFSSEWIYYIEKFNEKVDAALYDDKIMLSFPNRKNLIQVSPWPLQKLTHKQIEKEIKFIHNLVNFSSIIKSTNKDNQ